MDYWQKKGLDSPLEGVCGENITYLSSKELEIGRFRRITGFDRPRGLTPTTRQKISIKGRECLMQQQQKLRDHSFQLSLSDCVPQLCYQCYEPSALGAIFDVMNPPPQGLFFSFCFPFLCFPPIHIYAFYVSDPCSIFIRIYLQIHVLSLAFSLEEAYTFTYLDPLFPLPLHFIPFPTPLCSILFYPLTISLCLGTRLCQPISHKLLLEVVAYYKYHL